MSIVAQCPHCGMKSSWPAAMVGKPMQCPNLDCRKTFTLTSARLPVEPPPPPPPEPPPPPRRPEKPRPPSKPAKAPKVVDAEIVEAAIVNPPKVKEVQWSAGADIPPPAPPGKRPVRAARADEPEDEPDDQPVFRRRKKKDRRALFLIAGVVGIVVLAGAGIVYVLKFQGDTEAQLAAEAETQYKAGEFAAAAKSYEKLAADFGTGESGDKYKFFAELSALRLTTGAVGNRENPEPAFEKLKAFAAAQKASPFAKPTSGFGRDVYEAGRKLGEDIAGHADDRVKAYQADRGKAGELQKAEQAVALGRELIPVLDPFRGPDEPPLDRLRTDLDGVEAQVKREKDRTAALAKAAADLQKVSDAVIQTVEAELSAAGFLADPEAQALITAAKGKLQDLVRYEKDPAEPRAPPPSAAATILFVSPLGPTRRPPPPAVGEETQPAVFLAVARGILYALDEDTGSLLWAVRVGPDVTDPPTVVRVELDSGPTDLAVVTSNVGGEAAVAGYVVRTGAARWYQPLPAPAAGPAVVVGSRAYVPVRDEQGTIYEFDLTTGNRRGRIKIGQPVGPAAVLRPGTPLLYAAADARRVYVIEAGTREGEGDDPRCIQVIATGHPGGTLRTPPVFVGPEGEAPGERWLILAQADGPTTMNLRAFPLAPIPPPSADGKLPPETPAVAAVELTVPGWAWFPPVGDGDRLAMATDAGQFRLFGVNQPGNFDKALFPLPTPTLPAPPDGTAVPGLVFPAEEAAFWVLVGGEMRKYRLGLVPSRGLEVLPVGARVPLGVPTQLPQLNNRKDAACVVVRSPNSAGSTAVLIDLRDGEVRWRRQLGLVPAAAPVPQDVGVLLVAEDGGLVLVPGGSGATAGRTLVAPPTWVVAAPPAGDTDPTAVAVSADGKTVFTVTPVRVTENDKPALKFLIRRVSNGQVVHEGTVTAPAGLAGRPVVVGGSLLIPAADGFVYRHNPGTGRTNPDTLAQGPSWAGDRRSADAQAFITPLSETGFLTTDGGKKLSPWEWPKAGPWAAGAGKWELRERPAGPGVLLPPATVGEPGRVLVADVTGSVWLYPADRGGAPIRRWRPGAGLPAGKPTSGFVVQVNGGPTVAYTVDDRFLVCLDPNSDVPKWSTRVGEEADAVLVGPPQASAAGWLATDIGGRVTAFEGDGGKVTGSAALGLPGVVPAAAAGPLGDAVLAPVSDGSAVVLTLALPASKKE